MSLELKLKVSTEQVIEIKDGESNLLESLCNIPNIEITNKLNLNSIPRNTDGQIDPETYIMTDLNTFYEVLNIVEKELKKNSRYKDNYLNIYNEFQKMINVKNINSINNFNLSELNEDLVSFKTLITNLQTNNQTLIDNKDENVKLLKRVETLLTEMFGLTNLLITEDKEKSEE